MTPRRTVMIVMGTRPEAIKLAPIVLELERSSHFDPVVVVTAQHREMLDQVLELFDIAVDHDLNVQRDRQTLAGVTVRALDGVSRVVSEVRPDAVALHPCPKSGPLNFFCRPGGRLGGDHLGHGPAYADSCCRELASR